MSVAEWTGNAHLLCSSCGEHDAKTMVMFADVYLCKRCRDALVVMVREARCQGWEVETEC